MIRRLHTLETAARLHDIGKIGVPDRILLKPGPLTLEEKIKMELHPTTGTEILRSLAFLGSGLPIIENHHEWYDGRGYPHGLREREIPLGARILAVADAYDAMTSERPYRPLFSRAEAIAKLREGAGTQWDPEIVEAFIQVLLS